MGSLLDYLAAATGLFLSDLRYNIYWKNLFHVVLAIDSSSFPLEEWNYAYSYIFHMEQAFSNSAAAKEAFLNRLHASF